MIDQARYTSLLADYDALLAYSRAALASIVGTVPPTEHHRYGEKIFVKLLAHCMTLRRLSPEPIQAGPEELWDLGSSSAVARSVIEAYDALAYISFAPIAPEERSFRLLLWKAHGTCRRIKMLEGIGSTSPDYLSELQRRTEILSELIAHPLAKSASALRKRIEEADPPPYHLSKKHRCAENEVDYDYYEAVTIQLSQFVHTHPFSVDQLFAFRAGSEKALHLMALPVQFAIAFLARATAGFRTLFPGASDEAEADVGRLMETWSSILRSGLKMREGQRRHSAT